MYDIIGDIHGNALELEQLLAKLGYQAHNGYYHHPERTAVFLGDFIDRGPAQKKTVDICRAMVEAGTARAVMGNHEFNAICFATPDAHGDYLRPHHKISNVTDHQAFLDEFPFGSAEHDEVLAWFRTLPLFLDLGDIRIVHAVWHHPSLAIVAEYLDEHNCLLPGAYAPASDKRHPMYDAIEHLLKGIELELPSGYSFQDKGGKTRTSARIKWWQEDATHWHQATVGAGKGPFPQQPLPDDVYRYRDEVPLFVGHYWLNGEPEPLTERIACVDYSVARPGGKLTAYRWSGEKSLRKENFVWVERAG